MEEIIKQQQAKVYSTFYNMLKTAIVDLSRRDCPDCLPKFLDRMVENKTISEYSINDDDVTFRIHEYYVGDLSEREESIDT